MTGCFGGSAADRHFEGQLNAHLDRKAAEEEDREPALDRIAEQEDAERIGPDKYGEELFERKDGSRFRATSLPEREPDFDRDEETGRIYPSGWTWGRYSIEDEGEFTDREDLLEELASLRVAARAHASERVAIGKQISALREWGSKFEQAIKAHKEELERIHTTPDYADYVLWGSLPGEGGKGGK